MEKDAITHTQAAELLGITYNALKYRVKTWEQWKEKKVFWETADGLRFSKRKLIDDHNIPGQKCPHCGGVV